MLSIARRVHLALLLLVLACTSLRDELQRAEAAFVEARYDDVEVWLSDLAPSVASMNPPSRVRYYYLGGMSAYRIGERARARHLLALCRAELESTQVALPEGWTQNLARALTDLR